MSITLEIITPESVSFRATCEHVIVPTESGAIDILPGHRPLVSLVEPGEVIVSKAVVEGKSPEDHALAVDKGFVRVLSDVVTLIVDAAVDVDNIDFKLIEDARKKAEEELKKASEAKADPDELERLQSVIRFTLVQGLIGKRD